MSQIGGYDHIFGLSDYDNLELEFKEYKLINFKIPLVFSLALGLILGGGFGITDTKGYLAFKDMLSKKII